MNELAQYLDPTHPSFHNLIILFVTAGGLFILLTVRPLLVKSRDSLLVTATLSAFPTPAKWLLILASIWQMFVVGIELSAINLPLGKYPILTLIVFVHAVWYGFRVIRFYELASLKRDLHGRLDKTAVTGIAKLLRLLLTAVFAIVGFDLLGLDPSGLIALGSVSGAALAFASKDLVSNWFGGIMLYMDKPFKVGDWIRSPDRDIEGIVEYIGWRITKIRTFDKRPLYVPNSLFNSITVQNPSRMTHRRIKETIGVRYDDLAQVQQLVSAIESYLKSSERIAQDQVVIVNFDAFGASSLNIMVYCMTVTTDWVLYHQHKQAILLDIANLVDSYQCDFAYPTQRIQLEQNQSATLANNEST